MTFLSPIPALIAAAITIPGLLILYFLKLRRRPLRVSSTLLWDQAIRDLQVNVPFRIVRPTWLLLLQLLILALFLLALARPAIDLPQGAPSKIILLIDRSASMSARDAGTEQPRTRLDLAKQRALERIDALSGSGAAFSVVAFAAEPSLINAAPDASAARAAVQAVQPSDQPGNLTAALHLAGNLVQGDTSESEPAARGLVILFSDGSFASGEAFSLAGAEFRYERIGPPVDLEAEAPAPPVNNLGIVAIAARREWDDPTTVRMFARVQNALNRPITTPVSLIFDNQEIESSLVTIPAATAESPGSAPVPFKLDTREGGVATVRVEREDILPNDNAASLVISPASKPPILVVIPDAADGPRTEWIITNVIEELRLPMRVMSASLYAQETSLQRFELVIFDRVTPAATPPIASLSFGAGLPGYPVGPAAVQGGYITSWMRTHPVLRHASLESVFISKPLLMHGISPDDELARAADGPVLAVIPGPPRRMIAAFDLAQTNWPVQVGFSIFLASAIDYLTLRAEEQAGHAFTTTEPARILANPGTVRISGPRQVSLAGPAQGGDSVNVGVLDLVGVYRVSNVPESAPAAFAVNLLDEVETAAAVQNSLEVSGQVVSSASGDSGPREVWPWLIAAALVLLSIEWFINAWMMRV